MCKWKVWLGTSYIDINIILDTGIRISIDIEKNSII